MEPVQILIADDHSLFRQGIVSLLTGPRNLEVIGQAKNGLEAVTLARQLEPDIILMDVHMPECDGLEATRAIKQEMPHLDIVMLTASEEDDVLFEAIKNGASGYLLKNLEPHNLFDMLKKVQQGEAPLSKRMAAKILEEFQVPQKSPVEPTELEEVLTPREIDVLEKIVEGYTDKKIAQALEIAENTVKKHVRSILAKLQIRNRVQAAVQAVQAGLVKAEA
jgi:DNA-binding NarL/FixJ family response regulator